MAEEASDLSLTAAQEALAAQLAVLPICSTMAEPLRPQHFLTRQNGTMVPLVALDELPSTVSLRGVPRTLSSYDVAGMTGLGTVESQHRRYVVDGLKPLFHPEQKPAGTDLPTSKYADMETKHDLNSSFKGLGLRDHVATSTDGPQRKAFGIEETRSALPTNLRNDFTRYAASENRPLTIEDLARHPAPGVKEYCSYWLRHGECDYAQQGCLYRHEMPLDPATLEKLGLRDIPRWYREKYGLGSYLALSAQGTASGTIRSGLMERNWREPPNLAITEASKSSAASPELRSGHAKTVSARSSISGWNNFANLHTGAYNSDARGPIQSPPGGCQAIPPSKLPSKTRHVSTARPGSRLVPADTETISARILREANEQLDAHEQQERAALQKYAPLVPQKAVSTESSTINTPPASDHETSSVEMAVPRTEAVAAATSSTGKCQQVVKIPAPAGAAAPAGVGLGPAGKKRSVRMGRARARRGADVDVDREAQRKAVARAKQQAEALTKAKEGFQGDHE